MIHVLHSLQPHHNDPLIRRPLYRLRSHRDLSLCIAWRNHFLAWFAVYGWSAAACSIRGDCRRLSYIAVSRKGKLYLFGGRRTFSRFVHLLGRRRFERLWLEKRRLKMGYSLEIEVIKRRWGKVVRMCKTNKPKQHTLHFKQKKMSWGMFSGFYGSRV
jgi:hypothetical protein